MTARQYLESSEPYGYLADPRLEARWWLALDLRLQYDGAVSKGVFDALCGRYIAFQRSRSTTDRLAAWRSVRACHGWFGQLGGCGHGLS